MALQSDHVALEDVEHGPAEQAGGADPLGDLEDHQKILAQAILGNGHVQLVGFLVRVEETLAGLRVFRQLAEVFEGVLLFIISAAFVLGERGQRRGQRQGKRQRQ